MQFRFFLVTEFGPVPHTSIQNHPVPLARTFGWLTNIREAERGKFGLAGNRLLNACQEMILDSQGRLPPTKFSSMFCHFSFGFGQQNRWPRIIPPPGGLAGFLVPAGVDPASKCPISGPRCLRHQGLCNSPMHPENLTHFDHNFAHTALPAVHCNQRH